MKVRLYRRGAQCAAPHLYQQARRCALHSTACRVRIAAQSRRCVRFHNAAPRVPATDAQGRWRVRLIY